MHRVRTYTGKLVDVANPDPETIDIVDIARGLSHQCRYNGQLPTFYSVAQHSIIVAHYAGISGLLHDAAEAYIGDLISPLKVHCPIFRYWERQLLDAISKSLGVKLEDVSEVDKRVLATECRDLDITSMDGWSNYEPYNMRIVPSGSMQEDYMEFLRTYRSLT